MQMQRTYSFWWLQWAIRHNHLFHWRRIRDSPSRAFIRCPNGILAWRNLLRKGFGNLIPNRRFVIVALFIWVNIFMEKCLQWKVKLRHLLNDKTLFTFWKIGPHETMSLIFSIYSLLEIHDFVKWKTFWTKELSFTHWYSISRQKIPWPWISREYSNFSCTVW